MSDTTDEMMKHFGFGFQNPDNEMEYAAFVFNSKERWVIHGIREESRWKIDNVKSSALDDDDFLDTNETFITYMKDFIEENNLKYIWNFSQDFLNDSGGNQMSLRTVYGFFMAGEKSAPVTISDLDSALAQFETGEWELPEGFVMEVPEEAPETIVFAPRQIVYGQDGERVYNTREIRFGNSGIEDVELMQKCRKEKRPVMLQSAPGTGKSSLLEAAFGDFEIVVGQVGTSETEVYGGYHPDGSGGYKWVDGKVVEAAKRGVPCFIDEVASISPTLLTGIYPAMDGRNYLVIDGRPESAGGSIVKCEDGFWLAFAYNKFVPGAVVSEALVSRCLQMEFTSDYDVAAQVYEVPTELVTVCKIMKERALSDSNAVSWTPQMREINYFERDAKMVNTAFAWSALLSTCRANGEENYNNLIDIIQSKINNASFQSLSV